MRQFVNETLDGKQVWSVACSPQHRSWDRNFQLMKFNFPVRYSVVPLQRSFQATWIEWSLSDRRIYELEDGWRNKPMRERERFAGAVDFRGDPIQHGRSINVVLHVRLPTPHDLHWPADCSRNQGGLPGEIGP